MVIYFSRSRKTEVFAKVLGEMKGLPLFELRSELNEMPNFRFMLKALRLALFGKTFSVDRMPESLPEEIFVCSPIWGGNVTPPVKYFLQHAKLKDVRVNILLTASMPTDNYIKKAEKLLENTSCLAGNVCIFATNSKEAPDEDLIREHLKEAL